MTATTTYTLSRPLKTHSGEIKTLTLKEPTARAFVDYGEPFKVDTRRNDKDELELVFVFDNNKALVNFMSDMIEPKVDDLIIGDIPASDFRYLRSLAANIILSGVKDKSFTEPSAA